MAETPCSVCGTWACLFCGHHTSGRNRFYPGQHSCPKCKRANGKMLPIRHRSAKHQEHFDAPTDSAATPHYPLDQPAAGRLPSERNIMSTQTAARADRTRVTAPIKGVFDLDSSAWDELPRLRATLGDIGVQWSVNDNGKIETDVSLTINGSEEVVSFWATDSDGVLNTAQDTSSSDDDQIWGNLQPGDFEDVVEWGKQVHLRICAGIEYLISEAASPESDAYKAIIAYATGTSVKVPVFAVHELGEDGDRWLVFGTTEETAPSLIKTDVGKWLVETLGVEYNSLPDLIEGLQTAELTYRDNWVLVPVDPTRPDEGSMLKPDEEADHALPRFAATLVTI